MTHRDIGVALSSGSLETPYLLLSRPKVLANVARMKSHLGRLGIPLRPHMKTAKSIDVARLLFDGGTGPITVSTLKEAEYFHGHGFSDQVYAVGIAPNKLDHVLSLRQRGAKTTIILDSLEAARAVAKRATEAGGRLPVLIEIDTDRHRSGIAPGDALTIEIGKTLHQGGAELRGVITHAGGSYDHRGAAAFAAAAEEERSGIVAAATMLRDAGLPCPVVSVGSTPTAQFAADLNGVTEVRAGVFMFFDLFQAGIGACAVSDMALSVVTTVIGHQRDKGQIIVDAGWMAMSRDRSTAKLAVDQGYGVVCDIAGSPIPDLIMGDANQEHGLLSIRKGSQSPLPDLPLGATVRILPNHACSTGAQHDRYFVHDDQGYVAEIWPRFSGW